MRPRYTLWACVIEGKVRRASMSCIIIPASRILNQAVIPIYQQEVDVRCCAKHILLRWGVERDVREVKQ